MGHAQTWRGNIDKNHNQEEMYPKTPVTPGGISGRLLPDHANGSGDMSAWPGLNPMLGDWDCYGRRANGPSCLGSKMIGAIRRLAPDKKAEPTCLAADFCVRLFGNPR